ncbi:MAG: RecX family transcriptional regulator [Sphingomonas bacterium]|uniref:RecX family transcriptional regulator n=1 Tax=Sphingomonas bacterium TaxID=1895847 RepID=UPI00261F1A22|nr:RecX family transcriptional regulator [Sphingomonas bacterium]MDB5696765.1 RecX family transcriptional regulator [Sphingomonas bacterium]
MKPPRSQLPPLDTVALERLALRYVERFATTRGKLSDYLRRKIRERGWEGTPADPTALAERMAALGYVDDLAWAQGKAAALNRRGLGARRVSGALMQARVEEADREAVAPDVAARAVEAALAFARRKRLGPWARETLDRSSDRVAYDKQLGAMLRAGHPLDLSRRVLALPPGVDPSLDDLR